METLPNEILLHIFSYLELFDLLTGFWSLNIRFNSLVCLALSIGDNSLNTGLIIKQGLSYNKFSSLFFPLILNSSSLSSSIRRIHFDETNSIICDLIYELLLKGRNILRFPNLKSLILTRCISIEPIIQNISYLIEYQLDELTLTFDHQVFIRDFYVDEHSSMASDTEKEMILIKQLLCQLFSGRCRLKSLRLDISNEFTSGDIHQCLVGNSYFSSNFIVNQCESCCMTLRRLFIRLKYTFFLENLIEHVPNLEEMSVQFEYSLNFDSLWELNIETSNAEFVYLKRLLNNLNYVEKLKVHLKSDKLIETRRRNIWKSVIDANFIRHYCLPDKIINLINFDFYIYSQCQLSSNDIKRIIKSFYIHSFFVDYKWTNVKCLFDPIIECQHLFSCFTNALQFSDSLNNYSYIFNWPRIDFIWFDLYPSLHLFLEQFNELSPNISCIEVHQTRMMGFDESDLLVSLKILCKMKLYKGVDMPFRNVTKIQFGTHLDRMNADTEIVPSRNEIREKVLAHLISMTVQLKYLLVERFEWLLHVVQCASDELRREALSTVQYAEFCLPSCSTGSDESIHIGKHLVPFLSTYMSHLQTLRLWQPDDFSWTTTQHVAIFERDLCRLVENLKEFTFLDINGEIHYEKVESYRSMVQARFPHCRSDVGILRFRLWL
ncbi:unnamed protein product [Rotaria socialis]|uniref:F-box domain-containing protein n=2 Tax=Rotaria socialis TaxID=392032 RepID=A0A817WZ19_9BILA|nr:unnamed protein product [Rotaria socialis]